MFIYMQLIDIKQSGIMRLIPIDMKYSKDYFDLWSNFEVIKYTNKEQINTQRECNEIINQWINEFTDKDIPNNFVIEANTVTDNLASVKILENMGFIKTKVEEMGLENNGFELDVVHFIKAI